MKKYTLRLTRKNVKTRAIKKQVTNYVKKKWGIN